MNERIILFMKVKNLSAAELADEIGVQRSAVSHLLSGRNNPSLGFMQKILEHYPDVRSEWLIMGKGSMFHSKGEIEINQDPMQATKGSIRNAEPDLFDSPIDDNVIEEVSDSILDEPISNIMQKNEGALTDGENSDKAKIHQSAAIDANNESVEMIVVFMTDGTFKTYRPANQN